MRTANEIYEDMVGTCKDSRTDEEKNDMAICNEIDLLMFNCECCGWWCEMGENCVECYEDQGAGETCDDCCPGHD